MLALQVMRQKCINPKIRRSEFQNPENAIAIFGQEPREQNWLYSVGENTLSHLSITMTQAFRRSELMYAEKAR